MYRKRQSLCVAIALLPLAAACGSSIRTQAPKVTPITAPAPRVAASPPAVTPDVVQQPPAEDPVLALIAESQRRFAAGQRELELGHVEAARQAFNRSVELLLESPYGGRTEPRIREHFDRLVDRISTYEVKALAEGDGFAEKQSEPASIDELLALSTTFGPLAATPELKDLVQSDLLNDGHDIAIPLNQRVL